MPTSLHEERKQKKNYEKFKYLKAKEELWKTQIFHHAKNIIFQKFTIRNQNDETLPNIIKRKK
jgi:SUMO ligase MMS21 Smc5/6 complex component